MVSPPTARGEPPRFYKLDPLRFQSLCRDLYEAEPKIATAEVFGVPGQPQRGVDIVATHREGGGIGVGQCKCIKPDSLTPALVRGASQAFLDHLTYWQERGVRRFILFVASDASRTEIQEESLRQRDAFRKIGIEYELWDESTISNKLRPQPGITSTYLGDHWKDILCGTAVPGFPRELVVVDSLLLAQVETLTGLVSTAAEDKVEALRLAWRCGRRTEVVTGLSRLHDPSLWQAFPSPLRATILRFEGQLALEKGDLSRAKQLANESCTLNPAASVRLRALIARAENHPDQALELLKEASDVDSHTLRAALLMEGGQVSGALSILGQLTGHAEAHRLRALLFTLQHDLAMARLEVEKAVEVSPTWHATLYTKVLVNYLSGLSSAVLPKHIPPWPEPQDWHFVKTDDRSRGYFGVAAATVTQIEAEAEATVEERRVYEAWHLACLANDPERRDEATQYCRDVLVRDPVHYRALAWALARRLDVELFESEQGLRERIASAQGSPPEVIALALLCIQRGDHAAAKSLFEDNHSLFKDADSVELWQLWMAQLAAAKGEVSPQAPSGKRELPELVLVELRAVARANGDCEPLIIELRKRADLGDSRAAFELCDLLASLQRWNEALPAASVIIDGVETSAALMLACTMFYNAKQYDECLRQLDSHRDVFPHSELPTQAKRLRLAAQRELGLLPAATASAEDLFRSEPSTANFRALSEVYFEKGDFASLAVLARKHEQFQDLSNADLLRQSLRVSAEDKSIASALWRRASSRGFRDEEVLVALEVGYKLGLDRELRSLVHRLPDLAAKPERNVWQMDLDQVREHLLKRRDDVERILRSYRMGDIPVHFAAENLRRPLVSWYHRALLLNETYGRSVAGPTLARSGWRVGRSITLGSDITPRLHADLTALLMAFHLGVLEKVEATFRSIVLPHRSVIALAVMRDKVKPGQPARAEALRMVQNFVTRTLIRVHDEVFPGDNTCTVLPFDARTAQMLTVARRNGWLLADFLPLTDNDGHPVTQVPDFEDLLRTPHAMVEALRSLGEISEVKASGAFDALGPEHGRPVNREVSKGATVLCSIGVLELLASGGVLEEASRTFALSVTRSDFDILVVRELLGFRSAEEDATWLTGLIEHINHGIDRGAYQLLPDLAVTTKPVSDVAEDSITVGCLLNLFQFSPSAGDVIWVDDRWITGFAHRDGVPIVDTFDLLYLLRDRSVISTAELVQYTHRLRESDVRLLSLDVEEIKGLVQPAEVRAGQVVESRELRTLRRYYANSLSDGNTLRVAPSKQGLPLEWPFLLASGASVINAVVELWEANETFELVRPRAEWVLRNLYTPDRGRGFTQAERSAGVDHHLEAVALSSLLTHPIKFDLAPPSRHARREYLKWIYQRLLRRRFEADPHLGTTTLDAFKTTMLQSVEGSEKARKHLPLARALMRELFMDLPDELRAKLAEDGDFLGKLGVSMHSVVHLGPHHVNSEELWHAAMTVLRTREGVTVKSGSCELVVKLHEELGERQLVIEDAPARMNYVLPSELIGVLSDSVAERESALRRIARVFDLTRSSTEEAIARIASLSDAAQRAMEVASLRGSSAQNGYLELERKLKEHEAVEESDFIPQAVQTIVRHLRLRTDTSEPLAANLESAATTLLDEVGLEETVERFAGLPVPLPAVILASVDMLSPIERRSLLKRLVRALAKSPLGNAHVARLFARFASERPSYARYFHAVIRSQVLSSGGSRFGAWLKVLCVFANDLCYVEAFRQMPVSIRLCVVWSHADRLFRILANASADIDWIRDDFGNWSARLPAEVGFAEEAYTTDVAHPRQISGLKFALAGCAYVSEQGSLLDEDLRKIISEFVEAQPAHIVEIMRDLSLNPDALESILRHDGHAAWLSVFTPGLQERLSLATLRPQIVAAIDAIRSGQADLAEWFALNAIVHEAPFPGDLVPALREALLRTDLALLHRKNSHAGLLAAIVSAQHAGRLDHDVIDHMRAQLVALAKTWSQDLSRPASEVEHAGGVLLSAAFYLFSRAETDGSVRRYACVAQLLDEMVKQWPTLLDRSQLLVDRLIEGLPNADARWLWQLQVKLRAAR